MNSQNIWTGRRWNEKAILVGLPIIVFLGLIGAFIVVEPTRAASLTVTNNNDSGAGSLRQAISDANSGDTITFAPQASGAIILTSGELVINKSLTITGPGAANLTISGNNASRVFIITAGIKVDISNLTIADGYAVTSAGGGIINFGTLTLTNSIVSNNVISYTFSNGGGGIYNDALGTLTLVGSTIYSNTASSSATGGGGLSNYGGSTIVDSTIISNTSDYSGGGIYNTGTLTMTNDVVTSNTAMAHGGGISNSGTVMVINSSIMNNTLVLYFGGGVFNSNTLTVANSTVSGNIAPGSGGIANTGGTTNLRNVTISNNTTTGFGNSGGIQVFAGAVNFRNTILAGNLGSNGFPDCSGTLTSLGYNLIQDTTGCTIGGTLAGVITGTAPLLGPLVDNGGPTLTHALLPGSPAIDAGDPATPGSGGNACEATDQRGAARSQGLACDIGAYELIYVAASPAASSTLAYTDTLGTAISAYIPTSAVTQTTSLVFTPSATAASTPSGFAFAGVAFTLDAYQGGALQSGFIFQQPITVTLTYTDTTLGGLSENTLTLDYWTGSAWVDAATTCNPASTYLREPDLNRLSVAICHLSQFGLFGQRQIYLPLVLK